MSEKFGIENLKLLIGLPIELANIGDSIGHENSKSWKKWFKLVDCFDEIVDMIKVDWSKVGDEYDDLSDFESSELKEHIKNKFDIADDKLEVLIEESLEILIEIYPLVMRIINLRK